MRNNLFSLKALSVIILLFLVGAIPLSAVPWSTDNYHRQETNRTLSTAFGTSSSNSSFNLENSWRNFEAIQFNLKLNQAFFAPVTITHSVSQTITTFNTVACGSAASGYTAENKYYRFFNLAADFGISDEFNVSSAEFGVETFSGTALIATINIYSTSGTFPSGFPGNATLQGTATYSVTTADIGNIISVPVTATIPAGEKMIYELIGEDGTSTITALYFGSNNLGETDASYISAATCGITSPTTMASIGFPGVHMVMNVVGEEEGGSSGDLTCFEPNHAVVQTFDGTYIRWIDNTFSDTGSISGANFNPYGSTNLAFYWPNSALGNAGVMDGSTSAVLAPGDTVGPDSVFGTSSSTTNWMAGADGYLGFRFDCPAGHCYGYAHMTTTAPTGYPAVIVDYCIDLDGNPVTIPEEGGGGPFPEPYCEVTFPSDVEPITRVVYGDIDNSSDPTVNGSPAHEDFTAISTDIAQGSTNAIAVEGNTNGDYTTYVTVYIDWDQSGTFEASERTNIGTIFNSTGTDGIQATGNIVTPADATLGETRMRVLKKWGSYVTDACNSSGFGQAEDYTINVTEGGGGGSGDPCEQGFEVDTPTGTPYGVGFSSGNWVANDVFIPAGGSFTVQSVTFDMITISGQPTTFDMEIFEDNGTGGVGATTGMTYHFDSSNMSFVSLGNWDGAFPLYAVTLNVPDALLNADASSDTHYWLAISGGLSTAGQYTYWSSAYYISDPQSYPTWQYTTTANAWFEYSGAGGTAEGVMWVEGLCTTPGGGGNEDCDALFTTNAAGGPANSFAGVTFDIVNDTAEEMSITGFKIPVSGTGTAFDVDIYYTTTASTNVGVQQDPSEWTLLDSLTGVAQQNAVPFDPSTFSQVDLSNTLVLQPGQSKGIYIFLTSYANGVSSYRYSNGNFTETNGDLTILSNGYGSNATVFGNVTANRAFVGEVQYCVGEGGGGGTGDPCEIDFPHSNLDGTGNTQTLLFAEDFQVATGVTMTIDQVSVRMFNNIGQATTLAIYENAGGQPAASPLYTYSNVVPDSQTVIDNNYGMNIYDIVFTLPTTAELTEGTYWFAIQNTVGTDGGTNYWTITNSGIGQPGKYSTDGGVTWITNSSSYNYSFTVSGTCETEGGGGDGCLWTVHVWEDYYGDEVFWELRDSGGTVLISGGDYDLDYDDTQTVTNEGPVTFWITNDGFYGDNEPNYEVSNENGIVISGTMPFGGDTRTFDDLKCSDGGGGGGACENPTLEVNQDEDNSCMADFSQGGLAQSYKPLDSSAAGAGIKLRDPSTGLDVTLSLWDGLPNAGGTMLATGTTETSGDNWVDVFWNEIVNVTVGNTYYIVIEGDASLPCIAGSLNNPYPDGMVFANDYGSWPSFDYTFRTYSCSEAPSGPCADKIVMDCGVTYTADLVPDAGEWVNYTGVSWSYTGSEQVFEFTAPSTGTYLFEPVQGANDADFMVMDACSNTANNILGSTYWTGQSGGESLALNEGDTIYIIADLWSGAGGPTTVSIKVTCPEGPPPGDCPIDYDGDFVDGLGNLATGIILAADFPVPAGETWDLSETKVQLLYETSTVEVSFYEDAGGLPGTQVFAPTVLTPTDQVIVGDASGTDVYEVTLDLSSYNISLTGGMYWMAITTTAPSGSSYWHFTETVNNGSNFFVSLDGYASWEDAAVYGFPVDGAFTICTGSTPPPPPDCEQDFYTAEDPISGAGFSSGNWVANDVIVPGNTQFTMQTMTFETVALSGQPTNFDLEIFEDNGSGGVGNSTGMTYHFDSSNMTFTPNGFLFGVYPQFTVVFNLPDILLQANGSADTRYWLAVTSDLSSTSDFTYWVSYLHSFTPIPDSNPTWQYLASDGVWAQYDSSGPNEGYMKVEGHCETLGTGDLNAFDFAYYPNPVRDVLNITSQKAVKSVEAFNMTGQKVLTANKVVNGQIDVNALSPGVYVFKAVLEGGQVETFKIIKK